MILFAGYGLSLEMFLQILINIVHIPLFKLPPCICLLTITTVFYNSVMKSNTFWIEHYIFRYMLLTRSCKQKSYHMLLKKFQLRLLLSSAFLFRSVFFCIRRTCHLLSSMTSRVLRQVRAHVWTSSSIVRPNNWVTYQPSTATLGLRKTAFFISTSSLIDYLPFLITGLMPWD